MFATQEKQEEIRQKYLAGNYWYGHAKHELLEIYLDYFKEAREKYDLFQKNPEELYKKLEIWNKKANELADLKYEQLKSAVWL
jgi:tryptophanyl-tRNA synthetase